MWIDRLTARLGARGIIAASAPGMGWLLTECIPVLAWAQVTGALLGESFYLVTYLTLLGAEAPTLALLPLVAYAGNAGAALLVLGRHRQPSGHDAKRRCVIDTGLGRVFWLGTILWPLLGLALGWSAGVQLAGVFAAIFATQLCHSAGGSMFVVWTQAVIPPAVRGRFWIWRNCMSFGSTALVVLVMGAVLPKGAQATAAHLPWLMGIFAVVTLICLASTWMLARCPDMPAEVRTAPRPPLREAFATAPGYGRLLVFNLATVGALAISMAYLPALLHERGIGTAMFAAAQGSTFFPAMLVGILGAGWGLARIGGRRLLTWTSLLMLVSDLGFLAMPDARWLPACLVLSGITKGLWSIALIGRQHELCPPGDARFPALLTGSAALLAMALALGMRAAVPWLELHVASVAWTLIACAAGLRFLALAVLASGR